jgi:hypothetical protein
VTQTLKYLEKIMRNKYKQTAIQAITSYQAESNLQKQMLLLRFHATDIADHVYNQQEFIIQKDKDHSDKDHSYYRAIKVLFIP